MAFSIEIDRESGLALVSCSGELGLDDARRAAEAFWETPEWPGKLAVWDFRAARFDLSASDVKQIAEFILGHQRERPPEKIAFVTPRDVDFGLARMFEAFRDDPRTAFRVFRDYGQAISWARSPEPSAD